MNREIFDITVIGGGPIGLFSVFYSGMRQAKVKLIESLPHLGGQLATLYPEKYIYDIAGFPKVLAQDLIENLKKQIEKFDPTICLEEAVEKIEKQKDNTFVIHTNKKTHYSKAVILTAGNGVFQPRLLGLEGEETYAGKNLHYFVTDLNKFKDKRVVIFGGGDSAVDWTLMLAPIAKKVIIVHRRDQFRAHEFSVDQLMASQANVLTPFVPTKLIGNEEKVTHVQLQHAKTKEAQTLEVDDVIVNFGFVSTLGPIKDWGLEIEKNAIVVNSRMETNIPGIFAAGDVTTYDGKVKLIATGFGEAPTAVNNAKAYIDPEAKKPKHSTFLFEEKEE